MKDVAPFGNAIQMTVQHEDRLRPKAVKTENKGDK